MVMQVSAQHKTFEMCFLSLNIHLVWVFKAAYMCYMLGNTINVVLALNRNLWCKETYMLLHCIKLFRGIHYYHKSVYYKILRMHSSDGSALTALLALVAWEIKWKKIGKYSRSWITWKARGSSANSKWSDWHFMSYFTLASVLPISKAAYITQELLIRSLRVGREPQRLSCDLALQIFSDF